MSTPNAPSVLDILQGGWVCRAGVYREGDVAAYDAVASGIQAGLFDRARGHGISETEWWVVDSGIPTTLRKLQKIAGWTDAQLLDCLAAVHRFGVDARLLIGVMAVDRDHPEHGA